jgi:DNA-directed RNA polymerase specialized sigma24 family protein
MFYRKSFSNFGEFQTPSIPRREVYRLGLLSYRGDELSIGCARGELDVDNVVVSISARQLIDATLNQISEKVRALLDGMPQELRIPFELAYTQGLTHSEISEQTGDPLGTTKTRIRLALNLIRKKLNCKCSNGSGNGHV